MPISAIHPGEHLAEELEALDMSAAELARKLDVPTNRVTQILNGTRAITGDTALRLAHFFGTSAQFWLNLQTLYELRLAQQKAGKSITRLPGSNVMSPSTPEPFSPPTKPSAADLSRAIFSTSVLMRKTV